LGYCFKQHVTFVNRGKPGETGGNMRTPWHNYQLKSLPIAVNSSDGVINLSKSDPGSAERVRMTNLVLSASATGTIVFTSNATELWRYTFPTGELVLTLPYNGDGWGPFGLQGEQLRIANSGSLTLTGCGNYYLI
jgi:hypothetical protein